METLPELTSPNTRGRQSYWNPVTPPAYKPSAPCQSVRYGPGGRIILEETQGPTPAAIAALQSYEEITRQIKNAHPLYQKWQIQALAAQEYLDFLYIATKIHVEETPTLPVCFLLFIIYLFYFCLFQELICDEVLTSSEDEDDAKTLSKIPWSAWNSDKENTERQQEDIKATWSARRGPTSITPDTSFCYVKGFYS